MNTYYDFQSHYCWVVRNVWLLFKNKVRNSLLIPAIYIIILYFSVRSLENLQHPKTYNYLYLLRFFFGLVGFVTNYKSMFYLNKTYYDLDVAVLTRKQQIYFPLYFFTYEIKPVATTLTSFLKNNNSSVYIFWDMNFFTEKKTNVGLFDLIDPINFEFRVTAGRAKCFLLNIFKLSLRNK